MVAGHHWQLWASHAKSTGCHGAVRKGIAAVPAVGACVARVSEDSRKGAAAVRQQVHASLYGHYGTPWKGRAAVRGGRCAPA